MLNKKGKIVQAVGYVVFAITPYCVAMQTNNEVIKNEVTEKLTSLQDKLGELQDALSNSSTGLQCQLELLLSKAQNPGSSSSDSSSSSNSNSDTSSLDDAIIQESVNAILEKLKGTFAVTDTIQINGKDQLIYQVLAAGLKDDGKSKEISEAASLEEKIAVGVIAAFDVITETEEVLFYENLKKIVKKEAVKDLSVDVKNFLQDKLADFLTKKVLTQLKTSKYEVAFIVPVNNTTVYALLKNAFDRNGDPKTAQNTTPERAANDILSALDNIQESDKAIVTVNLQKIIDENNGNSKQDENLKKLLQEKIKKLTIVAQKTDEQIIDESIKIDASDMTLLKSNEKGKEKNRFDLFKQKVFQGQANTIANEVFTAKCINDDNITINMKSPRGLFLQQIKDYSPTNTDSERENNVRLRYNLELINSKISIPASSFADKFKAIKVIFNEAIKKLDEALNPASN